MKREMQLFFSSLSTFKEDQVCSYLLSKMADDKSFNESELQRNITVDRFACLTLPIHMQKNSSALFHSSITSIVLNGVTCPLTTFINLFVLIALMKKEELRTAANSILASMAVSDFLVGFIVQPMKIAHKIFGLFDTDYCTLDRIIRYIGILCVVASFLNTCLFALDRCFATVFPYRYLEHVIYRKYIITITIEWLALTAVILLTWIGVIQKEFITSIIKIVLILVVIAMSSAYTIVFRAVRRQRSRVACQHQPRVEAAVDIGKENDQQKGRDIGDRGKRRNESKHNGECGTASAVENDGQQGSLNVRNMSTKDVNEVHLQRDIKTLDDVVPINNFPNPKGNMPKQGEDVGACQSANEQKDAGKIGRLKCEGRSEAIQNMRRRQAAIPKSRSFTVLIIMSVFILCYCPLTVIQNLENRMSLLSLLIAQDWGNNFVILNSLLNPIIYCMRVSKIRREVFDLLRMLCGLCCRGEVY